MKKLTMCASMVLVLTACHKMLDLNPHSSIGVGSFYQTADDMENAMVAVYSGVQAYSQFTYTINEIRSDNLFNTSNVSTFSSVVEDGNLANIWRLLFSGIFRANTVLEYVQGINFLDNRGTTMTAEARFWRAYFYFDLVRYFGPVPVMDRPISGQEGFEIARNSAQEVYQFVADDFQYAVNNLPEIQEEDGRPTSLAARGLLAKVYLSMGRYDDAENAILPVIGKRSLLSNYADVFSVNNEYNDEVLLAIKYAGSSGSNQGMSTALYPMHINEADREQASRGGEGAYVTYDLMKQFDELDSRKGASFKAGYVEGNGVYMSRPYVYKYIDRSPLTGALDIIVLRYSDVLLTYAEILVNLNRFEDARTQTNLVRSRAFGNSNYNWTSSDFSNGESALLSVLQERRLELCFENQRWFDLVRNDRFIEECSPIETQIDENGNIFTLTFNITPVMAIYPIPLLQMELHRHWNQNPQ